MQAMYDSTELASMDPLVLMKNLDHCRMTSRRLSYILQQQVQGIVVLLFGPGQANEAPIGADGGAVLLSEAGQFGGQAPEGKVVPGRR